MPLRDLPRFVANGDRILAGQQTVIPVANPAAGGEWTVTVPGGRQWRLLAAIATLTTSATVANRFPRLSFSPRGARAYENGDPNGWPAGGAHQVSYAINVALMWNTGSGNASSIPIPSLWLPETSVIGSHTINLDAADQWSAVTLWIEELWFTDQDLHDEELLHEHATTHLATGS